MALNITKTTEEIDDAFGGIAHMIEVDADTGLPVAAASGINLGYVVGTQWEDKSDKKSFSDDTTENVATRWRNRTVTFSTNLMQYNDEIAKIPDEVRGKVYRIASCKNNTAGSRKFRIFAVGSPSPNFTVKQGDEKSPFEALCSPAPATITLSVSALTGSLASGGLGLTTTITGATINAGSYYVDIKES